MGRRVEDDATIIEGYPLQFAKDDKGIGKGKAVERAAKRKHSSVVDGKDGDPVLRKRDEEGGKLSEVGGEDHFILAWGRGNAAAKSRGRQLLMSTCLNAADSSSCPHASMLYWFSLSDFWRGETSRRRRTCS